MGRFSAVTELFQSSSDAAAEQFDLNHFDYFNKN